MTTTMEPEVTTAELVALDTAVIEQQTRAQIEIQMDFAARNPRNTVQVSKRCRELIESDRGLAAQCFYSLPRAGKTISGPSVRLAELAVYEMRHILAEARVVEIGDKALTAQGSVMDLERNIAARVEIRARITNKNGNRYNDDMITTTANAAIAKAYRTAVFKVIPGYIVSPLWNLARDITVGNAAKKRENRDRCVEYYGNLGIPEARILAHLRRPSILDVTAEDLEYLLGLKNSLEAGEVDVDEVFQKTKDGAPLNEPEVPGGLDDLADKLNDDEKTTAADGAEDLTEHRERANALMEGAPGEIIDSAFKKIGVGDKTVDDLTGAQLIRLIELLNE